MGFISGHKKIAGSGMRKGQLTRRSQSTADAFERIRGQYGEPLEALAAIAFDLSLEPHIRISGLKELCQYGYAKYRSVEFIEPIAEASDSGELTRILDEIENNLQKQHNDDIE